MKKVLLLSFLNPKNDLIYSQLANEYPYKAVFKDFIDITIVNEEIYVNDELLSSFDFVFLGLFYSNVVKSYFITEYLKRHTIPFLRHGAFQYDLNKINQLAYFTSEHVPYIPTMIGKNIEFIRSYIDKHWSYPIITKPFNGARGKEVLKHDSFISLEKALTESPVTLLIQPFISNTGDYRVIVLNHIIIGIIKRQPTSKTEFRANISLGGIASSADLPESIKKDIIKLTKAMNLALTGIDVIQDSKTGNYYIMEVNEGPQFKGFMAATNINIPDTILSYISRSFNLK